MIPLSQRSVLVIGAGLAGSLLACFLSPLVRRVLVVERRPDPRRAGYGGGRSINLALSARGLAALAEVGLDRAVMERDAIPMRGRALHPAVPGAPTVFQPYSSDPADAINSVSRGGLNLTLLNAAAALPNVELRFDHRCTDADFAPAAGLPSAAFAGPGGPVSIEADLVVATDGAYSAVRGAMLRTDRFEYSQSYLEHGYKELHIPPAGSGGFALDPNALHIWPRGGAMMIALPNRDGSFTCTLFWPLEGEHGLASLRTPDEVRAFFERHYPDAVPLMPTLAHDYLANPNGSLVTVRCRPWRVGPACCLLGDAAHAIVPFYGQGMNCAFEDCAQLARSLQDHPHQPDALAAYEAARKPNADAIADMALANFVEMRDLVGRPEFLLAKRVEQTLHKLDPERAQPQYNLVSFSTVPYAEAQRRGAALAGVVERTLAALRARLGGDTGLRALADTDPARFESLVAELGLPLLAQPAPAPAPAPPAHARGSALIDLSPTLSPRTAVWPGDTPLSRRVMLELAKGDPVTLSSITTTLHLGSHADGPNHYHAAGPGIADMPLHHYIGPAVVVEATPPPGTARLTAAHLRGGLDAVTRPRVLLRLLSNPASSPGADDHAALWPTGFPGLDPALIHALADRGVITIGVDTPSVDTQDSKDLPAHAACAQRNIAILEGLRLDRVVTPGEYELLAQPLKLDGADASPIRAVLR